MYWHGSIEGGREIPCAMQYTHTVNILIVIQCYDMYSGIAYPYTLCIRAMINWKRKDYGIIRLLQF